MHANTEVPTYDTSTDIDVCYEGYRQKATGQKATGQKATGQKATRQKATERNVKVLLSCYEEPKTNRRRRW